MLDFFILSLEIILDFFLEIQYWLKIKKRRKFEKENNLPKSFVWPPYTKQFLILFAIFIIATFAFSFFRYTNEYEEKTKRKLDKISEFLDDEKKQFGYYPKNLKTIIRNNPLRKNITLDYYKNEFVYNRSKDSLNYKLTALGKDQKINTSDDLIKSN